MLRSLRPLLVVVLVAFSTFARASSLRLIAPAPGTTLRGGSVAELHWSATELPAEAEEWEAFLSVDGGEYYAFRVTPHLDIELQRFTFTVPNVDARDARVLLRVGDEVRETSFEVRGSFAIVRDPHAEATVPPLPRFERGEAAREGERPVLFWTEGARDGEGLTQQSATPIPEPSVYAVAKARCVESVELTRAAGAMAPHAPVPAHSSLARAPQATRESLRRALDLLLICRRRNI